MRRLMCCGSPLTKFTVTLAPSVGSPIMSMATGLRTKFTTTVKGWPQRPTTRSRSPRTTRHGGRDGQAKCRRAPRGRPVATSTLELELLRTQPSRSAWSVTGRRSRGHDSPLGSRRLLYRLRDIRWMHVPQHDGSLLRCHLLRNAHDYLEGVRHNQWRQRRHVVGAEVTSRDSRSCLRVRTAVGCTPVQRGQFGLLRHPGVLGRTAPTPSPPPLCMQPASRLVGQSTTARVPGDTTEHQVEHLGVDQHISVRPMDECSLFQPVYRSHNEPSGLLSSKKGTS